MMELIKTISYLNCGDQLYNQACINKWDILEAASAINSINIGDGSQAAWNRESVALSTVEAS